MKCIYWKLKHVENKQCRPVSSVQLQWLTLCWADSSWCFQFGAPLGAVAQIDQNLDGVSQSTQALVLRDELRGAQGVLKGGERTVRYFFTTFIYHSLHSVTSLLFIWLCGGFIWDLGTEKPRSSLTIWLRTKKNDWFENWILRVKHGSRLCCMKIVYMSIMTWFERKTLTCHSLTLKLLCVYTYIK